MWVCFVDLEKAYDRVNREVLWATLEQELGVPVELMGQIREMYRGVRARVKGAEGVSAVEIPVREGVK